MIYIESGFIKGFSKDEKWIIGRSLVDAWGYPYKPEKIEFILERDEYKRIDDRFKRNHFTLTLGDLKGVINSLELLYYENFDLEALYNDVTREDVKKILNKLRSIKKKGVGQK